MQQRVERSLAAIVAADVAGYSRLMGVDEEGTLAQLKAHRRALVDPKIREHRGKIIKTIADGLLVEFASAVDAVRCAVKIQRGMAERNSGVPQAKRIEFRIGINVGDVIHDDNDIFGDGVNVAARLLRAWLSHRPRVSRFRCGQAAPAPKLGQARSGGGLTASRHEIPLLP